MQKALLRWRRVASTPTLHRHIVIIIIIRVTTMTKCFPESSERWELRSFKPCRNFTSFHFRMNAKTFALSTRRASSSFSSSSSPCCSVQSEGRFFVSSAATSDLFCVFSGGFVGFVAVTADSKVWRWTKDFRLLPEKEVSQFTCFMFRTKWDSVCLLKITYKLHIPAFPQHPAEFRLIDFLQILLQRENLSEDGGLVNEISDSLSLVLLIRRKNTGTWTSF